VHADDLANCQVLIKLCAVKIMQLDHLDKPAFECRRASATRGGVTIQLGAGPTPRELEFIDAVRQGRRCLIHFLRQRAA